MSETDVEIQSIEKLVQELDECENQQYGLIASRIDIPQGDLMEYATFSEEKYTRTCLRRSLDYELLLLGWEAGQQTPIHGHGDQKCWVHIVQGDFEECLYQFDEKKGEMELFKKSEPQSGATTFMRDEMGYHSLKNKGPQRALSLHLYAQPIEECEVYNEEQQTLNEVQMAYDVKYNLGRS